MPYGLDMELAQAAYKLVKDVMKVSKGEEVVITADTSSDWRVVEATANAVKIVEGKPIVAWYPTPPGVGKVADPYIPLKTLTATLKNANVWVEFNKAWLLYSTPYEEAMKEGKTKYMSCRNGYRYSG